jgi:hypothetical protein
VVLATEAYWAKSENMLMRHAAAALRTSRAARAGFVWRGGKGNEQRASAWLLIAIPHTRPNMMSSQSRRPGPKELAIRAKPAWLPVSCRGPGV